MADATETLSPDVAIVGAGLSGLALAADLVADGLDVLLLETRPRLGGRILGRGPAQAPGVLDAGPAWIWPHNRRMLALADRLSLPVFQQYAEGNLAFQDQSGAVRRDLTFAPMAGSLRLAGGLAQMVDRLADRVGHDRIRLGHRVTAITLEDGAEISGSADNDFLVTAKTVVSAVPPRVIVRDIAVSPPLPKPLLQHFSDTPTWMAGHAKLLAIYDQPFWRAQGLSGDAMSQRGPLAEIHDASPSDAMFGALFGFVGVPAAARSGQAEALKSAAVAQLADLFGAEAASPRDVILEDWAQAPETATEADWTPPAGHPHYARPSGLKLLADRGLIFGGTELSPEEGGFLEGALASAEAAKIVICERV